MTHMTGRLSMRGTPVGDLLERSRQFFAARGLPAWVIGGYVRDLLLNVATHDGDLGVGSRDVEMVGRELADEIGGSFYVLDQARRYVRVLAPHNAEGARIQLDLTPIDDNIVSDLSRRDFTIDAMALPIDSWDSPAAVIDPFDGRGDLRRSVIRIVRDDVFLADGVRLLRAVRLARQLDFLLADETAAAMRRDVAHIADVSAERLKDELCKLLALPDARGALRTLENLGIRRHILPELDRTQGVEQPSEHYWDVFNHLIETVGYMDRILDPAGRLSDPIVSALPWSDDVTSYFNAEVAGGLHRATLTRLACLLHDIAKPETKTVDEEGRTRFLGHPEQGADSARALMERLHFGRRATDYVTLAVRQHLRPMQLSHDMEPPTRRSLYRYKRDLGDAAIGTLYLSMADYLAARGARLDADEWRRRVSHCSLVLESILQEPEDSVSAPLPANGRMLMEALGMQPGPELGRIIEAVREAFATGLVSTPDEAIAFARREREGRNAPLRRGERGHSPVGRGN